MTVVVAKNIIMMEPTVPTATAVAVKIHDLVTDPGKNFVVIMKDGRVQKNALL